MLKREKKYYHYYKASDNPPLPSNQLTKFASKKLYDEIYWIVETWREEKMEESHLIKEPIDRKN